MLLGSIFLSEVKNRSKDKRNDFTGKQDSLYINIFSNFRNITLSKWQKKKREIYILQKKIL